MGIKYKQLITKFYTELFIPSQNSYKYCLTKLLLTGSPGSSSLTLKSKEGGPGDDFNTWFTFIPSVSGSSNFPHCTLLEIGGVDLSDSNFCVNLLLPSTDWLIRAWSRSAIVNDQLLEFPSWGVSGNSFNPLSTQVFIGGGDCCVTLPVSAAIQSVKNSRLYCP